MKTTDINQTKHRHKIFQRANRETSLASPLPEPERVSPDKSAKKHEKEQLYHSISVCMPAVVSH